MRYCCTLRTHRLVQDLDHTGLHLSHDGRVAGSHAVLARAARDDHLCYAEKMPKEMGLVLLACSKLRIFSNDPAQSRGFRREIELRSLRFRTESPPSNPGRSTGRKGGAPPRRSRVLSRHQPHQAESGGEGGEAQDLAEVCCWTRRGAHLESGRCCYCFTTANSSGSAPFDFEQKQNASGTRHEYRTQVAPFFTKNIGCMFTHWELLD